MLTFNIGPSMLSENTKKDINDAVQNNILEMSHRSEEFTKISKGAVTGLCGFYQIPDDYKVFYTSSSTEAMQLAIANCCEDRSLHFVNGNFSGLSAKIARSLHKNSTINSVEYGQLNDFDSVRQNNYDLVTLAHNETSSGVMCSKEDIAKLREKFKDSIIAIDITSSAGAVKFKISDADIWYFSVQKCFGLPAGLGVIFVSPHAYRRSLDLFAKGKNMAGHFSFENMWKKMEEKYQTLQTPNTLNIYLLFRKLERWLKKGGLDYVQGLTQAKYKKIEQYIKESNNLDFFVKNKNIRSTTSVCIKAGEEYIKKCHNHCLQNNMILGKGYGPLKESTLRIANFPAVSEKELDSLFKLIS